MRCLALGLSEPAGIVDSGVEQTGETWLEILDNGPVPFISLCQ